MADGKDILWNLYQEHCAWERHHEEQRASVTNLLVAVAAGVLGVITFDGKLNTADMPLTLFLIMQGCFGAIFSAKQYECFALHQQRANHYREEMDRLNPTLHILAVRKASDKKHKSNFQMMSKLRLNKFWVSIHLLIALFGLVLTFGIWRKWFN